jgi:hypothetical protein
VQLRGFRFELGRSKATTSDIPVHIVRSGSTKNIAGFNAEINEIMQKLKSRGVGDLDLLGQLFHVYTACCTNETPFYRYIEGLENRYIDGDISLSTKTLMEKAETKYEELKDRNKFEASNHKGLQTSEADVVALPVQFTKQRRSARTPDWMTQRPTDGTLTKEAKGKTYNWCEGDSGRNHAPKWVIHHPRECKGRKTSNNSGTNVPTSPNNGQGPTWTTSMVSALQAE